jgi:UDP-N-acetylglucosamine 2-epimerase (non-hydrolysing)
MIHEITLRPVTVHLIVGARPNFMKIAPLYKRLKADPATFRPIVVHTGQHYDYNMSEVFFQDLELPQPDIHLGVGSASHAHQTAKIMMAYEDICLKESPDWAIVVGDVNSTLACALVAKKLLLPLAHLEAGLRSFDRTMPEEINRLITDALADLLWTPSEDADQNLTREGVDPKRICRVGNIMIDALEMMRSVVEARHAYQRYGLKPREYAVMTLHRPANVDSPEQLRRIVGAIQRMAEKLPIFFPVHPRTRQRLQEAGWWSSLLACRQVKMIDPLGYCDFMSLIFHCRLVITDSGGLQEETTYLGIPCLTLRENTERPITVTHGTNKLVTIEDLEENFTRALRGNWKKGTIPAMWDGRTAERVVTSLKRAIIECDEELVSLEERKAAAHHFNR